jgi:hypothetical protein
MNLDSLDKQFLQTPVLWQDWTTFSILGSTRNSSAAPHNASVRSQWRSCSLLANSPCSTPHRPPSVNTHSSVRRHPECRVLCPADTSRSCWRDGRCLRSRPRWCSPTCNTHNAVQILLHTTIATSFDSFIILTDSTSHIDHCREENLERIELIFCMFSTLIDDTLCTILCLNGATIRTEGGKFCQCRWWSEITDKCLFKDTVIS